jgi:hypothetical protein
MRYLCDGPGGRTWFQIDTEAEAVAESELMSHAVERFFKREWERAAASYTPSPGLSFIEQDIGLKGHVERSMPIFATLRDGEGNGLATAMLPPPGESEATFRIIIVGPGNGDPYRAHGEAIRALGDHLGMKLPRERCFPYSK